MRHGRSTRLGPLVGRYPGWRSDPGDLPEDASLQWRVRRGLKPASRSRLRPPYRCGGSAVWVGARAPTFRFPFNCEGMNAFTSTNGSHSMQAVARGRRLQFRHPHLAGAAMSQIEELADRVERLLLRHEELQRTNALLREQLAARRRTSATTCARG